MQPPTSSASVLCDTGYEESAIHHLGIWKWGEATATIEAKKVDVVETTINGRRVDFAIDRETHLSIRISFYNTINNKTYINVKRFSDYIDVNGIKVPQRVKFEDGTEGKYMIRFNVEYEPDIFVKPPRVGLGKKPGSLKARLDGEERQHARRLPVSIQRREQHLFFVRLTTRSVQYSQPRKHLKRLLDGARKPTPTVTVG